jgi:hypothetical protein
MSAQNLRSLKKLTAPLGGDIEILEVGFEGDVKLLRIRIRQGSRFTDLDLDPVTARLWAAVMADWAYPSK